MAKVLAITNQKGGVGKTTTAVNLAACLGALERRVLLVDFDPQGNATSGVGLDKTALERTVYHVVIGGEDVRTVIRHTEFELDVLPANVNLAGAEVELATAGEGRESRLKGAVDAVRDDYDFILIDSPPSLGLLSLNALTAADGVIIPIQCEFYALEGVSELMRTLDLVRDGLNSALEVSGVLLTMFDSRTNLSGQVANEVRDFFKEKVYDLNDVNEVLYRLDQKILGR